MNIGGRRNPKRIGKTQWESFATEIQLPPAFVLKEVQVVIRKVIDQLPITSDEINALTPDKLFVADLKQNILGRCIELLRSIK